MKFRTTRFGEIEFPEEVVMTFPEGLLGFHEDTLFILLEHDAEGSPFKWLQSLHDPDLAFIIVDPQFIDPRFEFEIDVDTARLIETAEPAMCAVMCIVNVPRVNPIRMTANFKAPIVVNVETRLGRQLVLGAQAYSIATPVFTNVVEPGFAEPADYYRQRAAV